MIIHDTGPIAAFNSKDARHAECLEVLETHPGPLLVPGPILTEVCYLLATRSGPRAEAMFLRTLESEELRLVPLLSGDLSRMADLVEQYADLPLGAADASVFAIAERLGVADVATIDLRHFRVVRPRHVDALTLLP
ncbi:PIN domain-containing protein [Streptomyces sp. A3M-1-3]|uniref:type II toxin-antitoxin system VapC family toxin n=1 Tax=Streptomyces sp. A3M-1-3 TaxID=2962044 RepID=UPI0020B801A2|nr:PIN domain-containing protein [Streptomyces sp. A3M-1-3]MCP3819858.1 PIN domain-containing protein [Streptomyces sp. A3M-1-3]